MIIYTQDNSVDLIEIDQPITEKLEEIDHHREELQLALNRIIFDRYVALLIKLLKNYNIKEKRIYICSGTGGSNFWIVSKKRKKAFLISEFNRSALGLYSPLLQFLTEWQDHYMDWDQWSHLLPYKAWITESGIVEFTPDEYKGDL